MLPLRHHLKCIRLKIPRLWTSGGGFDLQIVPRARPREWSALRPRPLSMASKTALCARDNSHDDVNRNPPASQEQTEAIDFSIALQCTIMARRCLRGRRIKIYRVEANAIAKQGFQCFFAFITKNNGSVFKAVQRHIRLDLFTAWLLFVYENYPDAPCFRAWSPQPPEFEYTSSTFILLQSFPANVIVRLIKEMPCLLSAEQRVREVTLKLVHVYKVWNRAQPNTLGGQSL